MIRAYILDVIFTGLLLTDFMFYWQTGTENAMQNLTKMEKKKRTARKSMIQLKSAEDVMNLFEDVVIGPIEIAPIKGEGVRIGFLHSLYLYSCFCGFCYTRNNGIKVTFCFSNVN